MSERPLNQDWYAENPLAKKKRSVMLSANSEFAEKLWPLTLDYYSPVISIFSFQLTTLKVLNSEEAWIFKDGLVPLLWFFKKHPKPMALKTKIYVSKEWLPFVPGAWKKLIGSYEVISLKGPKRSKRKNIVMLGLFSELYLSQKNIKEVFKKVSRPFEGKSPKKLPKFAYLPQRLFLDEKAMDRSSFPIEFSVHLTSTLGTNISPITHQYIFESKDLTKIYVMDVTDKYLCADNGLVHLAMGKGAGLWQGAKMPKKLKENELVVPLSDFHGFLLDKTPAFKEIGLRSEHRERLLLAQESESNQLVPWPSIFTDWIQDMIRSQDRK